MPDLSVLLPVRDAAPWLPSSLASLARQTFRDFEVIAVDDGSRDDSGGILERFAAADPRFRVIHTPPRGLPLALAAALERAGAPLLARQDADDLSHRDRLGAQREFLRAHRQVAVVGCRVRLFPRAAVGTGMRRWAQWHNRLLTHEAMAREAWIDSPLAHGSALMRRAPIERAGGWIERGWPEDLDLWLRLIRSGGRLAKLPATLYGWRQHPGSATRRDPRYAPERFVALKIASLRHGLLRARHTVRLVGVGRSLERWRGALEQDGFHVEVHACGHPGGAVIGSLAPPVVLVFTAFAARERWREALIRSDMRELDDFVFVA